AGALGAATGFGLRLHGGAGRGGDINTKKAYKCYFRGLYGDARLVYPIIPDTEVVEFDKLVLRSGFNDAFRTNGAAAYIRDQLIRELQQDMGAIISHGSWFNLFVNMRFRGLYNVVERMDEEFLESYTRSDAWDVIKTGNDVLAGENVEWERLHTFARDRDLSQDALFDEAAAMVDLENFTSYMILNTWAQNQDWPHNNWYAARRQGPEGRWIFLSWDAEFGIGLIPGGFSADSFQFTLNQGGYIRDVFAAFLRNAAYQEYFAGELDRHLFQALRPAGVLAKIDKLRARIAPDIPEEAQLTGNTLTQWANNISTCRAFAQNRGSVYRNLVFASAAHDFPQPPRVFACDPPQVVNTGGVVVRARGAR
ncbi:MAG: CotH kinase family protein, partial [Anaerolineales bacterium]